MKKLWKVKIALIVIAGVIAMTAVVMWLWNWLVPELFSGPVINFCQALGLMILTRILFRGFHGMRGHGGQCGRWGEWKDRYEKMSPEERDKMRSLWKKRCGWSDEEKKDIS